MAKKLSIMKRIFLLVTFCFSMTSFAQKAEVEQTVKTFFEAFHAKDTLKIKSVCHENSDFAVCYGRAEGY